MLKLILNEKRLREILKKKNFSEPVKKLFRNYGKLRSYGLSNLEIAERSGVSFSTFYRYGDDIAYCYGVNRDQIICHHDYPDYRKDVEYTKNNYISNETLLQFIAETKDLLNKALSIIESEATYE